MLQILCVSECYLERHEHGGQLIWQILSVSECFLERHGHHRETTGA